MQQTVHQTVGAVKAGRVRFDARRPDSDCVTSVGSPLARLARWRNHTKIRGFFGENMRFDMRGRGQWTLETHNRAIAQLLARRLETCLSPNVLAQLERLKGGEGQPFALIKAASYWGPMSPATPAAYAEQLQRRRRGGTDSFEDHHHTDIERRLRAVDSFAASLLHLMDAVPEFRIVGVREPLVRDMVSSPFMPELNDRSTRDMPLRFHQSSTEKDLPGIGAGKADGFVCSYKVYTCMWNYRRVPIYLLPVKDLLEALPEDQKGSVIATLQKPIFDKIGPRADIGVSSRPVNDVPLLVNGGNDQNPDWLMSFDPGRVWAEDDPAGRSALLILRDTLRRFSRNDAVREIKLRRRDVLVVDNMRALLSRREMPGGAGDALAQLAAGPRSRRWLRLMYGYPMKSDTGHSSIGAQRALSAQETPPLS